MLSRVGRDAVVGFKVTGESSFTRVVGVIVVLESWDTQLVEV